MFELMLSRHLIPPLFSALLGIGATIGVGCLLMVLSLFKNYYLSTEKVFMGIHPQIEVHKDSMSEGEANGLIQKLKYLYPEISGIGPAIYEQMKIEIAEVNAKKAFCVESEQTTMCLRDGTRVKTSEHEEIVTRFGFDILTREVKEVLLRGVSIVHGQTTMQLTKIINVRYYTDLDRLNQVMNANGRPIPLAFYMEGVSPAAVLNDYLLKPAPSERQEEHFKLFGVLDLGRKKRSAPLLVMSLGNAQKMLERSGIVNTIEIALREPYQSASIAAEIRKELGNEFKVTSWTEKERASFTFLWITKMMAFFLIFSISIVAAISVYSTLLLSVIRNRAKIALLKALGIKNSSIYLIFIASALVIGVVGVVFGTIVGYAGSEWLVAQFSDNLRKIGLDNPRTEISLSDFLVSAVAALTLFFIIAVVPAHRAATIDPVDNLQR